MKRPLKVGGRYAPGQVSFASCADRFCVGRRLWLRPGKTYLFGRTAAEPGQLALSHNTISRKHLTITVDSVTEGHAHNLSSRSHIKIEDLATKLGTVVNGQKIKGNIFDAQVEEYEIMLGKCPSKFRLKWHPTVFTFSFTNKELQTQPLTSLKERFEQLDIKLLTAYSVKHTTHVISKKRNTAKGLQALINGKYIVTETFLDAISSVAELQDGADSQESSSLETDFDKFWPNALEHLPPRGGEPVQHPDELYAPDEGRREVFEGYTFIFYSQLQYDNLMAPITNGGGKAMLHPIEPEETSVDDFVRYVKGVAGEKGSGSFNDGSEGKGVVLVRFLPAKGQLVGWYTEFITAVSLLLDHRPIEQNEFLEAILINDASKLRRPLEVESSMRTEDSRLAESSRPEPVTQQSGGSQATPIVTEPSQQGDSQPLPRRGRARKPVKRRFAGFDDDDDEMGADETSPPPAYEPARRQSPPQGDEGGLFVSQEPDAPLAPDGQDTNLRSQRKRPPSPVPEHDLMEGMATAAAKFKRQRLERGDNFAAPSPEPAPEPTKTKAETKLKVKQELDVLAIAAKNREEAEARAQAEAEDLANLPDGIDLAEIRRLNIVEEVEIRPKDRASGRTRDQDIADGRWDPKWNGMKNFKKFRKRGEVVGRQPARVIIALTEVKPKEFGVGDNYWLEDVSNERKKTVSQPSIVSAGEARDSSLQDPSLAKRGASARIIASDSSDEEEVSEPALEQSSTRATASRRDGTGVQSQSLRSQLSSAQTRPTSQGKRAATEPAAAKDPPPPKRTRMLLEVADSDDSDDDLKFRFGKRR
ncbi:campothecin resistance conferring [Trichoderma arundinaceum]|uniref:Campothecin resistance conferring n=1 Tax=Trichoderma arundinaceum TaxID=490622 RepID=A0A395NRZ9_TRIAR|nr:campothecin resistance conferring [Trichoderma arundinaceum]